MGKQKTAGPGRSKLSLDWGRVLQVEREGI